MDDRVKTKPNLSVLALLSFISAFVVARLFTTLHPTTVWWISGYHIHHFWYGIAMLAVGGWIGISVENEQLSRVASILFGAGGGLIGDEVGLLLTMGDYWTEVTYTFIIFFTAFSSILVLLSRYNRIIRTEFTHFLRSNASLYSGVLLTSISIAFILETDNTEVIVISSAFTIIGALIILSYFIQRMRK